MSQATKDTKSTDQSPRLLPKHDVFGTPENSSFYSANLYSDLDISRREIRLIKLDTSSGGGPVKCELLPPTPLIDAQGQYFTLSYCAGDPKATDFVFVNGVKCNIFANLHHALVLASHYWRGTARDGPFLLWIDQLCINQCDLKERSHQVNFMRHIYQCAERTIVCLSTSKANGRGMKWLKEMCHNVPSREGDIPYVYDDEAEKEELEPSYERGIWKHLKTYISSILMPKMEVKSDNQRWIRMLDYLRKHASKERFINSWISFYRVLESPWWSRAWICQEFLVSKEITFLFGHHLVSWEESWEILQAFCEIHEHLLMSHDKFFGKRTVFEDETEDRLHCRLFNHVNSKELQRQVDQVGSLIRMKTRWTGNMDIKQLLVHSRCHCKSSDDRDRIYSFIGLATLNYHIFPDYSPENTLSNVLIETMKSIIRVENSLDILVEATAFAIPQEPLTPSWVVNWTSKEYYRRQNSLGTEVSKLRSGIPPTKAEASFRKISRLANEPAIEVLEIQGILVDRICSVEEWGVLVVFKTDKRSKGIATRKAKCGDEMWILYGLQVPMILRPCDDGYQVVSCAGVWELEAEKGRCSELGRMIQSADRGIIARSRIRLY